MRYLIILSLLGASQGFLPPTCPNIQRQLPPSSPHSTELKMSLFDGIGDLFGKAGRGLEAFGDLFSRISDDCKTSLPQDVTDPAEKKERAKELSRVRDSYRYVDNMTPPGVPYLEGTRWLDEELPISVTWLRAVLRKVVATTGSSILWTLNPIDVVKELRDADGILSFFKGLASEALGELTPDERAKGIKDYKDQFVFPTKQPRDCPSVLDYDEDATWCRYRLAGPNPMVIKKATAADLKKFKSLKTDEYASLKADVDAALEAGELLIIDYSVFDGVAAGEVKGKKKYLAAPMALFRVNPDADTREMEPIKVLGIQLEQGKGKPIFQPNDSYLWRIAKVHFDAVDGSYHEAISHLGHTHLVIEAFIGATKRQLAHNHPLNKLLSPHMEGSPLINWGASVELVAKDNTVDHLVGPNIEFVWEVIKDLVLDRLGRDFSFPTELAARGMDKANFPHLYPYRDDAQMYWDNTYSWVDSYLSLYYGSSDAERKERMAGDNELEDWVAEMTSEVGGKCKWLLDYHKAGTDKYELLVKVVTSVIFTASTQHAAVNFPQSPIMSFTPAFTLGAWGPVPTDKSPKELKDYMEVLPYLEVSDLQKKIALLLGGIHYTQLGQYDLEHFDDTRVYELVEKWQQDIQDAKEAIDERNHDLVAMWRQRVPKKVAKNAAYTTLLPEVIPQSINI
ncbi:unnamed protein product [Chrysoparadoxa australica]